MDRAENLIVRAASLARRGLDGEAMALVRTASAVCEGRPPLGPQLHDIEALAGAGADRLPLREGESGAGAMVRPATAFALERLQQWAEMAWASEPRIAALRREGAGTALAVALTASARRLAGAQRFAEAGARCEEAVALLREAPGEGHWRDERLADALGLWGASEVARDNSAAALAAAAEACRLLRLLVQGGEERLRPRWGGAQHNLAGARLLAGDAGGAVSAITAAIALRREVATAAPAVFLADLATTLVEAARILCDAELAEDALAASEEAVAVARALADEDGESYAALLAAALKGRARSALVAGAWELGLEASDEEVALHRGGDEVMTLAEALHNRATFLTMLGDDAQALASVVEAIELRAGAPGPPQEKAQAALGASLHLAGKLAVRAGDLERSSAWFEQAARVRAALVSGDEVKAREDVAQTGIELARVCARQGRFGEALHATETAAAALKRLVGSNGGAHLPRYARALLQIGNLHRKLGAAEAAIGAYTQAARLKPKLCDAGAADAVAMAAAQKLIVCLKRAGRAEEAELWRRRFGVAGEG